MILKKTDLIILLLGLISISFGCSQKKGLVATPEQTKKIQTPSVSEPKTDKSIPSVVLPSKPIETDFKPNALEQRIKSSPVFSKIFTGFVLFDPESGDTLCQVLGDKYFTPASNVKILTLYAALSILEEQVDALKYVVRGDSLIFWGTGDPSLLNTKLGSPSLVVDFLKNRKEKLFFSPHNFKDEKLGAGWAWDDYPYEFQGEKSSMPIYGNLVQVHRKSNDSRFETTPAYFNKNVQYNPNIGGQRPLVRRLIHENIFEFNRIKGQMIGRLPFVYSDELLMELLKAASGKNIELYRNKDVPDHCLTLKNMERDEILKHMMEESDNFVAEQMMLLVSGTLFTTLNTKKAIRYCQDSLFTETPDPLVWKDGSGLSRYNLLTPRSIVHVLHLLTKSLDEERLRSLFPNGENKSYLGEVGRHVYAKTGSMSNKYCLSGYIKTKKNKLLIFSFMHNNYIGNTNGIKKEMADVIDYIHINH